MKKSFLIFFLLFFISSCGEVAFLLEDDGNTNPYENNVFVIFNGKQEERFERQVYLSFGNTNKGEYILTTTFSEKKENRLVKKNQVAEKIDYEIKIKYELFSKKLSCNTYENKIVTKFSFVPKSFGYNFGTDRSFEKLYNNSLKKNINKFIYDPKSKNADCV
tara:strand:+ start:26 stop:511 length:486 start_codon:yes stop_codon:yes gene_type:complete